MITGVFSSARTWSDMVKLSHSIFALPFAVMAAFLAGRNIEGVGHPTWTQMLLVIVCMVGARSVAMTFNRIVDAEIDARNPRTSSRPLPAGALSRSAAFVFLGLASALFVGGCLAFYKLFANPWPVVLSLPVLLFLCGYSYTKRFTKWSHLYLGTAIGFAPIASWLAIHPESCGLSAFMLAGAVTLWIAGFDIIYACQDIESDRREGLFSLPSRLGPRRALLVARAFHVLVVGLLCGLAVVANLGWFYMAGVFFVAALLTIENALVTPTDFSRVNLAFFTINGVVSVVLGVLAILDVLILSTPR
jgi:4-hydroxybenzoate polyprenyltransferase